MATREQRLVIRRACNNMLRSSNGQQILTKADWSTMANAGVLRVRRQTAGPENDLVENAIRFGLLRGKTSPLVVREAAIGTGFPDVVAAYPTSKSLRVERPPLGVDHLRLLQFLWSYEGATTLAAAQTLLRLGPRTLRRIVDELSEQRAIRVTGENVRAYRNADTFAVSRIVAVEAKISKWQDALMQAAGNAWFASHSYILLPSWRLGDIAAVHARTLGIGVLVLEDDRVATVEPARTRPIPASLGSWIVNEWVVRELGAGGR